jgi:spermidine synthase
MGRETPRDEKYKFEISPAIRILRARRPARLWGEIWREDDDAYEWNQSTGIGGATVKKSHGLAAGAGLSRGLRAYLYGTAGLCGAAIMIVQILGAKMLAPYLGTSHFVWTAQIAVTLLALAAGYYAGGRLADRSQRLGQVYVAVLLAALYLCATTLVIRPLAYWCLDLRLAVGSLLASTLLFFVPLLLLAMVGPFFVRVVTVSVSGVGGNVGRLAAMGTLGSFAGTMLIGYVLIPLFPNTLTIYLTSASLFAISGVYFLVWERRSRNLPAVLLGIGLGMGLGFVGVRAEGRAMGDRSMELYRSNSNFGMLQVVDHRDTGFRYLLNDYLVQNTYDPARGQSVSLFTYMLHDLAWAYTPEIRSALCIGLGIGIVPTLMVQEGVEVDVVEINPPVVDIARDFFDCPIDRFQVAVGDGRHFLLRSTNRYDTIILDAFLGDSSPVHLMTREAFESMRRLLRPEGTVVINCFAEFTPGRDFFGASLDRTLRSVFRDVRIHSAGNGNVFYVASNQEEMRVLREPDFNQVHPAVRRQAMAAYATMVRPDPQRGMVMTDNFNPVEFYDAHNREQIRRQLARSMRVQAGL